MPRITKVTTRKGDRGETGLGSGRRVPKDSPSHANPNPLHYASPPSVNNPLKSPIFATK
jgi:hypothetical protein